MSRILLLTILLALCTPKLLAEAPAEVIAKAVVLEDKTDDQVALIRSVEPSAELLSLLTLWKEGGIFLVELPDKSKLPVLLSPDKDADDKQTA
ncbi:MAG: urea ABC transporter permease subunit UrtB, partial [Verrucomicrobiota bacterium]